MGLDPCICGEWQLEGFADIAGSGKEIKNRDCGSINQAHCFSLSFVYGTKLDHVRPLALIFEPSCQHGIFSRFWSMLPEQFCWIAVGKDKILCRETRASRNGLSTTLCAMISVSVQEFYSTEVATTTDVMA